MFGICIHNVLHGSYTFTQDERIRLVVFAFWGNGTWLLVCYTRNMFYGHKEKNQPVYITICFFLSARPAGNRRLYRTVVYVCIYRADPLKRPVFNRLQSGRKHLEIKNA